MVCPNCNTKLEVANSRHQSRTNHVWRRRSCPNCGTIFTSHEKIDLGGSFAVKSSPKELEPFNRDKLFLSIYKSCGHRKNALQDSAALTDTIIARLIKHASAGFINESQIIETSVSVLHNFDKAAVVQYQAYHPSVQID